MARGIGGRLRRSPTGLRGLGGGGGGGAPNPWATLIGVANISNANFFATAAGSGPAFSATTGAVGMVWRKIIAGNLVREYAVGRFVMSTRGHRAAVRDGTTARVATMYVNATPANVTEQDTVSPTQNLIYRSAHINDGGTIKNYLNGSLMSAGTALPSYTAPNASDAFTINGSSSTVDEWELVSVTWRNAAIDAAAVAAWDAQVVALGSRAFASADGLLDQWDGSGTWVDSIGGLSLAVTGSPTRRDITGATFA